ncbi:uncharacterized protein LOC144199433 [Stigmatopora nigra]
MDKDKRNDMPEHSSWMGMHQFLGDLLVSSGSSAKEQSDVLNVWTMLGGGSLQQPRPIHKSERNLRHVCTCLGCSLSSSLLAPSEAPKESDSLSDTATTGTTHLVAPAAGCPEAGGSSEDGPADPETPLSRLSSLNRLSSALTHARHHFQQQCHSVGSRLPCPVPPFPCLASLQSHLLQRDPEEQDATPHSCMHCAASFARPSQLLQHQRTEHALEPTGFLCTECGRTFNSHSNLRIHLHVHTGARPYTCSECGKGFSQSGALKIHRRIHTGERPYSCGFCGRSFPHLAGVRAHQRIHTGEKPYRCIHCGKCFTQSGALKIHTRIHTGEKPFSCEICGKAFSNRSGVRFHYQTVHGLNPESTGFTGVPLGRPRTYPPATDAVAPRTGSPPGFTQLAQGLTDVESSRLAYVCEDCGLRFKDAPTRNKHQATVHYSADEVTPKEGSTNEGVPLDEGD